MPFKKGETYRGKKRAYVRKNQSAGVTFPITKLLRMMKRGHYMKHIGQSAAVYMSAVLQYIATEVLEIAGEYATANPKHPHLIQPRYLMQSMKGDIELAELFSKTTFSCGGFVPNLPPFK